MQIALTLPQRYSLVNIRSCHYIECYFLVFNSNRGVPSGCVTRRQKPQPPPAWVIFINTELSPFSSCTRALSSPVSNNASAPFPASVYGPATAQSVRYSSLSCSVFVKITNCTCHPVYSKTIAQKNPSALNQYRSDSIHSAASMAKSSRPTKQLPVRSAEGRSSGRQKYAPVSW